MASLYIRQQKEKQVKTEGDYYCERTEYIGKLEKVLQSLWHRHNDGSNERFWAEWDDVKEIYADIQTGVRRVE